MDPCLTSALYFPVEGCLAMRDIDFDSGAPMPSDHPETGPSYDLFHEPWDIIHGLSAASTFVVDPKSEVKLSKKSRHCKDLAPGLQCYELPPSADFFYGREQELQRIEACLCHSSNATTRPTFAVFGLGGVGKTSLALEFAHDCQRRSLFDCIFWINAESIVSIRQSFTDIACTLQLSNPGKNESPESNIILVQNWLIKTSASWLLIYDNLEDAELLRANRPNTPGCVLVTTRYGDVAKKTGGMNGTLELKTFPPLQSAHIFDQFRLQYRNPDRVIGDPDEEEVAARERVLSRLGGLPLGIEHVAAYIECDELTVLEFSKKYDRTARLVHERSDTGSKAPHTLATLWQVSLQQTREQYPDSFRLLCMVSMIAPDEIPLSLFDMENQGDEGWYEPVHEYAQFCTDIETLERAVSQLKRLALIKRAGDLISIHRLLQEAVALSMDKVEMQRAFHSTVQFLNMAFPKSVKSSFLLDKWPKCAALIQHVISVGNYFSDVSKRKDTWAESSEELRELVKNAAWYLFESGQSTEAQQLAEQGLAMCPDKRDLLYAHLCNTIAVLHFSRNELNKSRQKHDEAFLIRKTLLNKDDLELATCYHNLGTVAGAEGDQSLCISHMNTAMAAWSKQPEKTSVLLGLGDLIIGRAYFNKSDFGRAQEQYDLAQTVFDREQGGTGLFNGDLALARGNLFLVTGELNKAKQHYESGYRIAFKLAPQHILTASLLYKRGLVHHLKKEYAEALKLFDQALSITTSTYKGPTLRTVRRKALAMSNDPASTTEQRTEALRVLAQAEVVKMQLYKDNGLDCVTSVEICSLDCEEAEYDRLCGGLYR